MRRHALTLIRNISGIGLLFGSVLFAAALTPSLIPRTFEVQGVLAGMAFSAGYGIGVAVRNLWQYLELPAADQYFTKIWKLCAATVCIVIMLVALYHAADWQNSVRRVVGMEAVDSAYPLSVTWIAIVCFGILLFLARGLIRLGRYIVSKLNWLLPPRVSIVIGVFLTISLIYTITNGVLIRYSFQLMDSSFRQLDALVEPDRPQPLIAERAGSPQSKLDWRKLGRAGREFVASGPTAQEISTFTQQVTLEPIRLYAGLQIAETPEQRASLLLEELITLKAFERDALVIITPTGTGWVDPSAIDGLEFLLKGNVASVALQYSYLNSPLSLLFQPENGLVSSEALFRTVYNYWKTLPKEQRPKLYLHGLSLGAFNSQRSITFFDVLGDPIDGAVWSGPPFPSEKWRSLTKDRAPGSTEWLPVFQNGRFVRFMNQSGTPEGNTQPWGDLRFIYLQYGSDAITFFDKSLLYREADWMKSPRAPDVSPDLRWYPIVSMLQMLIDMPLADTVPMGYGHVFAPEHYLNAWLEVTGIKGWTGEQIVALKALLKQRSMRGDGYEGRGG
ncbi:alpha/beta hydrolase [Ochrobactrum sp. EDr1-4]|uniref:alpha/beta hydrolase n=1 Tax=Ochrobactrum sp. EDr1-4 TaxID=3368622 RepID=UPI003BA30B51